MRTLITHLNAGRYPWYALALSGGLLCGAWFFQYILGYAPCTMCYWQRHAHKAVIVAASLGIIYGVIKGRGHKGLSALIMVTFLVSAGYALWHVGVELGYLEGPKTCATGDVSLDDIRGADLIESLSGKNKPPACSEVVWSFLGLSMAGWNALASLFGAAIGGLSFRAAKP